MESGIQLAIIEKLRGLTSEDGLYNLCPPTPPVYSMADLDAIGRGGATAEELARESAWIRAVNVVPAAGSLSPAEPTFLWERLSELKLQPAEFALPAPGHVEASELGAAKALLYKNPDDVVRQHSDTYLAYQVYQHLHDSAVDLFHQRRRNTRTRRTQKRGSSGERSLHQPFKLRSTRRCLGGGSLAVRTRSNAHNG